MLAPDSLSTPGGDSVGGYMTQIAYHKCLLDSLQGVEWGPQEAGLAFQKSLAAQPNVGPGLVLCQKVRRTLLEAMTELVHVRGQAPE